jgi:hypothetical protein
VPEGDASDEEVKRAVVEALEQKAEQSLKAAGSERL